MEGNLKEASWLATFANFRKSAEMFGKCNQLSGELELDIWIYLILVKIMVEIVRINESGHVSNGYF